jgi:cation diffusion facilitator CzcD-associated flavoprotein CzcO
MPVDDEGLSLTGHAGLPNPSVGFDAAALRSKYAEERAKRLNNPIRGVIPDLVGELARYVEDPYTPSTTREPVVDHHVDVVIVGSGFAGLLAAARLREVGVERLRIIEKAGDVGGVWYWNRYPGAMCDVESHTYMPLLEELGYVPKDKYAKAPEILAHAQAVAKHFDLYDGGLFQTTVTGLSWEEESARWRLTTDRDDDLRPRFVIIADGNFSRLKLPAIPGIDTFQGHAFHTSRWDYAYTGGSYDSDLTNLADKTVGIVGTGATAVQVTPPVGRAAKQTYVFQRTPSTIGPRNNRPTDPEFPQTLEPGWQQERLRNFTSIVTGGIEDVDLVQDGWTDFYFEITSNPTFRQLAPEQQALVMENANFAHMEGLRARIDSTIEDRQTADSLKPYYAYFCTRPCFHDEFLQSFNQPNVDVVDTEGRGIERITKTGVVANGVEYQVDCLIFATGFEYDTSYTRKTGFDIVGRGGRKLSEKWADGLSTLHGFTTNGFPNLMIVPGSNAQATITLNVVHCLSEYAAHFAYIVGEMRRRNALTFDTDADAETRWVEGVVAHARDNAAFLEACTPNRFNHEGTLDQRRLQSANVAGSPLAYFKYLDEWRMDGALKGLTITT